jgi:hypothetical protein
VINHLSKAVRQELPLTLETVAALSIAFLRDSGVGYVDPIRRPRVASSITRCVDLDVTRVRGSKGAPEQCLLEDCHWNTFKKLKTGLYTSHKEMQSHFQAEIR